MRSVAACSMFGRIPVFCLGSTPVRNNLSMDCVAFTNVLGLMACVSSEDDMSVKEDDKAGAVCTVPATILLPASGVLPNGNSETPRK
jgi:hypothetical protein